jgi:hypothetical protein
MMSWSSEFISVAQKTVPTRVEIHCTVCLEALGCGLARPVRSNETIGGITHQYKPDRGFSLWNFYETKDPASKLAVGRTGLSLVPLGGDHKPAAHFEGQFRQPAISPVGHWIAYVSNESGSFEVFLQSLPLGHGRWQISAHGGPSPSGGEMVKNCSISPADHRSSRSR